MSFGALHGLDRRRRRPEVFVGLTRSGLLVYGSVAGTSSAPASREDTPVLSAVMNRLTARTRGVAARRLAAGMSVGTARDGTTRFHGVRIVDAATQRGKLRIVRAPVGCRRGVAPRVRALGRHAFEYPLRMGFSTLGLRRMVSAGDRVARYLGLEWSSLCMYVLAAIRRGSAYSTEAGLKYFIFGSVASGLYLWGASLIYGTTGMVQFGDRSRRLMGSSADGDLALGTGIGLVRRRSAFRFKLAVVPFHAWSPDVYEGSPAPSTIYFAVVPKMAMGVVVMRLCWGPFAEAFDTVQSVRRFTAVASRGLAALAARAQRRVKRFRAYSAIGHMGYVMLALSSGSLEGVQGARRYRVIYVVMSLNAWLAVMSITRETSRGEAGDGALDLPNPRASAKYRTDRRGLSTRNPVLAGTLALTVRSMAGIPPRAGFMAKRWVFFAAMAQSLVLYAVFAVLASSVSAFNYLRWVKIMYFDAPALTVSRDRVTVDPWTSRVRGVTLGLRLVRLRVPGPVRLRTHRMALALCR